MSAKIREVDQVDFEHEVLKAKKPVVVDFWAPWCGPCRMLTPIMEELAQEFHGRVKFVKVHTDKNPDLTASYGVRSIPTVIGFKKGVQVFNHLGFASAPVLRSKIQAMLDK